MSCPHSLIGDAETCSQCRGATPRRVTVDENGIYHLDGRPIGPLGRIAYDRETQRGRPRGQRKPSRYTIED